MTWLVRALVPLLLTATVWQVYRVRGRLSAEDADPAAIAELREKMATMPRAIEDGQYSGVEEPVDPEIAKNSGADTYMSVRYDAGGGRSFRLYVGGSVRNRENFHAPSYCMPATGWELLEESTIPFSAYPVQDDSAHMRKLRLQKGSNRMLVFYWFQAGDRLANHEWMIRFYRFLDLLANRPFRPTLIVTVYAPVVGSFEATEQATIHFLEAIGPHLQTAILTGVE